MKVLKLALLTILSSCSMNDEAKFASDSGKPKPASDDANPVAFGESPKANKIVKTSTLVTVEESHTVKAQEIDKIVDYLFVLDNSSSMQVALANATQGIKNALVAGKFKRSARIGVISTMPADPADPTLTAPHPVLPDVYNSTAPGLVKYDPGFLKFIDAGSVAFAKVNIKTPLDNRYLTPLCASGFFSPYDKHADGHYCIEAAMQTSFIGTGVEDGLLSTYQFFKKPSNKDVFRKGAELHVIFISDVHAPGVPNTARWSSIFVDRPKNADIVAEAKKSNPISDVFFHALAPSVVVAGCTESEPNWYLGTSYFPAVEETGGVTHDICKVDGYDDFINRMVKKSHEQNFEVKVDKSVRSIDWVKVDGVEVQSFKIIDENTISFRLKESMSVDFTVKIQYQSGT